MSLKGYDGSECSPSFSEHPCQIGKENYCMHRETGDQIDALLQAHQSEWSQMH